MKAQHSKLRIMPTSRRKKPSGVGTYGKGPRRGAITAAQFREARVFAGFTRAQAAEFLGVSLRTVGHWETGRARPPFAAFKLLRVLRHGDLVDPAWDGYRLIRGKLVTPEDREFSPSDLSWLSLLVRRAHAFSDLLRERQARAAEAARAAPLARGGQAASVAAPIADASGVDVRSRLLGAWMFRGGAVIGSIYQKIDFSPAATGEKGEVEIGRVNGWPIGPGSNTGQKGLQGVLA